MRCSPNQRMANGEWRVVKRFKVTGYTLQNGRTASEPGAQARGFASHLISNTQHLTPLIRALALAALTVPCSLFPIPSSAQMPTYHVGRTPTPEEIRSWDTAVGVDGKGLPPGSGTAKKGAPIYAQKCAPCHKPDLSKGGHFASLVGGKGTLRNVSPVKSIGSYYPFATTLWDYIYRDMPSRQEGSLTPDEAYALTAFLLYKNDIIKEDDVIDAKSLPKIQMPNRNGFVPPWPPQYKPKEKRQFGNYR